MTMLGAWYDIFLPGQAILLRDQAAVAAAAEVEAQKKEVERRAAAAVEAKVKELQPGIEERVRKEAEAGASSGTTAVFIIGGAILFWLMLRR